MLLLALLIAAPVDTIALQPGMVITRSAVVRPGRYRLSPLAPDSAVVRVRGDGLTLEMSGVILAGTGENAQPDAAFGIGILVEGGRDITIRNATIRGYKIGLLARQVRNLTLERNDVSYNWKPRLWSGLAHESLVDWLYFHHNEKDQWFRYGAGILLIDVNGGEIRHNVARQGMNGLQMVRTERMRVWNNDFSYLSGLGIGMYRSRRNTIMHNRLDYCVRGFVAGVYKRGQDSASLLMYEQSSNNVVAYNSMTFSGDGVFLWAGQSTMDTGKGGSNDNLFFGNDVSWAVANGIEATFSRNRFIGNVSAGSEYGLWGGYSWSSEIRDNIFLFNATGIAIEHGQDNLIAGNVITGHDLAIHLWANPIEPSDWGYPRHRDTRSRGYRIEGNHIVEAAKAIKTEATTDIRLSDNDRMIPVRSWVPDVSHRDAPKPIPGGFMPQRDLPRGERWFDRRDSILVDEWGPFDRLSPKAWLRASERSAANAGRGIVLWSGGPQGRWRVIGTRGIDSQPDSAGAIGVPVVVIPRKGPVTDWQVDFEFTGDAVTSPTGVRTEPGIPYQFSYSLFAAPANWNVRAVIWDSTSDPRKDIDAFRARLAGPALLTRADPLLDYLWGRTPLDGFPNERFGLVATGLVDLPEGEYELVTISDDGIRVWIDGRLAVDRWKQHESELEIVPLGAGKHALKVEYYQVDGWVELRVEVRRKAQVG